MRAFSYILLTYFAIALQIGVGGVVAIGQAWPNFGLILILFVALSSAREEGLLICFVVGALQDLFTAQPMGTFALSYGVTGLAVRGAMELLQPEHPVTHLMLAIAGGLIYTGVLVTGALLHGGSPDILGLALSVLYTAALAPVVLGVLLRLRPLVGFEPVRRKRGGSGSTTR